MSSSRKNDARIALCCVFVMAYAIIIVKLGRYVLAPFSGKSTQGVKEVATEKNMRRILNEERVFSRRMISERNDEFIVKFTETLSANSTSAPNSFAAIILKDNKLYCRKSQMNYLSRGKYFVQMLREGLDQYPLDQSSPWSNSIPILIKHDDSNGCFPSTQSDKYGYPRFTWSMPADKRGHKEKSFSSLPSHTSPWCSAIGMPSYKIWRDLSSSHEHKILNSTTVNDDVYPWNAKLSMAVWRGSTTYNNGMYGDLNFLDLPRSQLVMMSIKRPDLIDAGFHKLVGKYEKVSIDASIRKMLKDSVPLKEMMRYKGKVRDFRAEQLLFDVTGNMINFSLYLTPLNRQNLSIAIIDIDGNNWSARFPSLLCTNSVIIKITPDFVEQTTSSLHPNVHYVPSSLNNLTAVVENIMDESNDWEMKNVVSNANKWCLQVMRKEFFAKRAIDALEAYITALENYDIRLTRLFDDLVECTI